MDGVNTIDRPRSVLFVDRSPDPSYGGSKRVLVSVASALDRARWTPHAQFYCDGPYVKDLTRLGIPAGAPAELLATLPPPRERSRAASLGARVTPTGEVERSRLRRGAREMRSYWHLMRRDRLRARRILPVIPKGIDLIHVNGPMHLDYEWAHVAASLGVPFVTHEHGGWRTPPVAYRFVARRAASVICLTEERAEMIRRFCGKSVRPEVVPNGVDPVRQSPKRSREAVRAELGIASGVWMLATPGHFRPWKGQALAVEAAAALAAAGVDFRWVLFGSQVDEAYVAQIRRRLNGLGIADRFVILGERDDVPDLLAAADLAVHTTLTPEPFGMIVVEAMCVGTPVVGAGEGAIPSILRDGVDGWLYQPREATSLAETILRALGDRHRLRVMGEGARRRVREEFSLSVQVSRLTDIYSRALGA